MSPRRPSRVKDLPAVALDSPVVREDLPAPVVYYPNHYGTFFAFAGGPDEQPALCACAEGPIRNLLRLDPPSSRPANTINLRMAPLDSWFFPNVISMASLKKRARLRPLTTVQFQPGLCHRCNVKAPTLRWCHEMYGTKFVQGYGWYINQTFLRFGIRPMSSGSCLPDVCPPEYRDVLEEIAALDRLYWQEHARLWSLETTERRDIPVEDRSPWPNVTKAEMAAMTDAEKRKGQLERDLRNAIESVTRKEFGFRPVGEGWVRETQLYYIVRQIFPEEEVLRHYRPEWMDGLELDVYIPGRRIALEYQGEQHFRPIKVWGGEPELRQLQERDAHKAEICRRAGVHLVVVDYTEPMTDDHIRSRLGELSAY